MANVDHPHGLKPVMQLGGGPVPCHVYEANVTTAIFQGDVVTIRTDGRCDTLKTASGANNIIGVAANYVEAGTTPAADLWVYDDPNTIFEVQSDGTTDPGETTAQAAIGATANLVLTTGNTSTGLSKHELDYSDIGTDTTAPLRIYGYHKQIDNDKTKAHAKMLVIFNRHFYKMKTAI